MWINKENTKTSDEIHFFDKEVLRRIYNWFMETER